MCTAQSHSDVLVAVILIHLIESTLPKIMLWLFDVVSGIANCTQFSLHCLLQLIVIKHSAAVVGNEGISTHQRREETPIDLEPVQMAKCFRARFAFGAWAYRAARAITTL